ncbi:uncharacterized [Tachysurus ichikawai]
MSSGALSVQVKRRSARQNAEHLESVSCADVWVFPSNFSEVTRPGYRPAELYKNTHGPAYAKTRLESTKAQGLGRVRESESLGSYTYTFISLQGQPRLFMKKPLQKITTASMQPQTACQPD